MMNRFEVRSTREDCPCRICTAACRPRSPALPFPSQPSPFTRRTAAGGRPAKEWSCRQRRPRQHPLLDADANQQGDAAEAARRLGGGAVRRWRRRAGDAGGERRPAVHHGRLLRLRLRRQDGRHRVEASDRRLTAKPPALTDFTRPEQGLPAREGVAVGDGLVYVGLSNAHVDRAAREDRRAGVGRLRRHRPAAPGPGRVGRARVRRRPRVRRHVRRSRLPRKGRRR